MTLNVNKFFILINFAFGTAWSKLLIAYVLQFLRIFVSSQQKETLFLSKAQPTKNSHTIISSLHYYSSTLWAQLEKFLWTAYPKPHSEIPVYQLNSQAFRQQSRSIKPIIEHCYITLIPKSIQHTNTLITTQNSDYHPNM